MNVTQVAIRPTEASIAAQCPALTPELLAASGARYSRNNEGLGSILAKINPNDLDASVDSIFKMIDYGHQSIADMAPVSMFIDGISIWLAYFIWTICPTAGGQESSTRYIKLDASGLVDPAEAGVPERLHQQWTYDMAAAFEAYGDALNAWEAVATEFPTVLRIPQTLLSAQNDKAKRTVARLKRNYAFDRARYFLPSAALTNVMIVMSARGWIQLCQHLLSHMLPEANQLGAAIRDELRLCVPRLINHAELKESISLGIQHEFKLLVAIAARDVPPCLQPTSTITEAPCTAALDIAAPNNNVVCDLAADLDFHHNRYAWIGEFIRRISVRFSWSAVAFAEIRDLNRHRTGNKYCPLVPQGFYCAMDQLPHQTGEQYMPDVLASLPEVGRSITSRAHDYLLECDPSYVYSTLLGSQYPFEHLTTGDKFIYEAELRTGLGAHFRYAQHLHDALSLWYDQFPTTRGAVLEGTAEPE